LAKVSETTPSALAPCSLNHSSGVTVSQKANRDRLFHQVAIANRVLAFTFLNTHASIHQDLGTIMNIINQIKSILGMKYILAKLYVRLFFQSSKTQPSTQGCIQ
jgi:hypothetical protein